MRRTSQEIINLSPDAIPYPWATASKSTYEPWARVEAVAGPSLSTLPFGNIRWMACRRDGYRCPGRETGERIRKHDVDERVRPVDRAVSSGPVCRSF